MGAKGWREVDGQAGMDAMAGAGSTSRFDWRLGRLELEDSHLAYVDLGPADAEPVVLLHGYLGSHRTWRHQIDALRERYRVIAPDWFGWGASGRDPRLRYDYETDLYRLRRMLDVLGVESCNLFGHDYGGFLALGFTERYPGRVRRLALLNSRAHATFRWPWLVTFGAIGWAARTPGIGRLLACLPLEAIHRRALRPELEDGIFDLDSLDSYVGWLTADPQGARFFVRFHADYEVGVRSELGRKLSRVACPTAVIWGTQDEYLSSDIAQELAVAIRRAKLTMVYGAGHFVTEERPNDVTRALADLLGIESPRGGQETGATARATR